jgi:YHS domain-containing protein
VIRFVLIIILLLVVAWAFWRLMDGIIEALGGTTKQRAKRAGQPPVKLVRDPVCGTYVRPDTSLHVTAGGTTHYFCSDTCRAKFRRGA